MSYYQYKETNLYYEVVGEGAPVILIHGWGIDHNYFIGCMEPVFHKLDEEYKRIYIDLPGMGKSSAGNIHNADDITELLVAFIQNVSDGKQVLLAGCSFGGLLSCAIAIKIPEMIKGMMLVAPATGVKEKKLPKLKVWRKDEAFLETMAEEEKKSFLGINVTLTKKAWEAYKTFIYPAVLKNRENDFLNHVLDGSLSYDLIEKAKELQFEKPVLFLTGKQDTSVGYEDPYQLSLCYPSSTYLALDGAGHNLPFDRPELYQMLVIDWIKSNI